jgi:hypothetical protein
VVDADREEMIDPFDARVAKRMKVEAEEELGDYFDRRLILGSAAEVERVWSMADKILQPARFSTSPILLEIILFLKFKNEYWDKRTVAKAISLVQEEDSNERYDKEIAQFWLIERRGRLKQAGVKRKWSLFCVVDFTDNEY